MSFTSFPLQIVPRMVLDTKPRPEACLLNGCLQEHVNETPWFTALHESNISRMAPLMHHRPFI